MKIYNLILLNFYFLQIFPLLFGMYPGEGSSGSHPGRMYQDLESQLEGMHLGEGSGSQSGGMYQGEGSSGSQSRGMNTEGPGSQLSVQEIFNQVTGQIGPFIQNYRGLGACSRVEARQLGGPGRVEEITKVGEQYNNLVNSYKDLLEEYNEMNENLESFSAYQAKIFCFLN